MDEKDMLGNLQDKFGNSGLVLERSIGQSLVFGGEHLLTLNHVEGRMAMVALTNLRSPNKTNFRTLNQNEAIEIRPRVWITFIALSSNRPGARFLLDVPENIPVLRKEVYDALRRD
jgi:sRNA-binding carbon storage regulator CsrA